jgi:hypothetical protein
MIFKELNFQEFEPAFALIEESKLDPSDLKHDLLP